MFLNIVTNIAVKLQIFLDDYDLKQTFHYSDSCYCIFHKVGDKGKSGPAAEHNWSDTGSEEQPDSPSPQSSQTPRQADHEYHEISDEENQEEEEHTQKVSWLGI